MPMDRVEFEQIGPNRYVGWVEGGGTSARRKEVRGATFEEIMDAVADAHAELTPAAPIMRPTKEVLADQAAVEATAKVAAQLEADAVADAEHRARAAAAAQDIAAAESERLGAQVQATERTRDELIADGEEMGLTIDRRWGDTRLREVVEAEHARRHAI